MSKIRENHNLVPKNEKKSRTILFLIWIYYIVIIVIASIMLANILIVLLKWISQETVNNPSQNDEIHSETLLVKFKCSAFILNGEYEKKYKWKILD